MKFERSTICWPRTSRERCGLVCGPRRAGAARHLPTISSRQGRRTASSSEPHSARPPASWPRPSRRTVAARSRRSTSCAREPIGVAQLAQMTGLTRYVRATRTEGRLQLVPAGSPARTDQGRCPAPGYDFCFLDGAHLWEPDALAALLVTQLLRPGGWLLMDDLHFRPARTIPGWETAFSQDVRGRAEHRAGRHGVRSAGEDASATSDASRCRTPGTWAGRANWAVRPIPGCRAT